MKRIVLQHPDGMSQIVGTADQQPDALLTLRSDGSPWNLVAAKRHYYLFKPVMSPSAVTQAFHDQQR